ncbi:histidine kinase osmosensor [Podila epigama]|nr:histidine kinase osmosensor [Podila epigama]
MLRAISTALDNILVGHPPEEMAIILQQKDESLPNGGTWAIIEDKFQPGKTQSTLTWTDLSERRDHMPVLVRKALDTQEPVFSTAVGSRSQLPTIACVPIIRSHSGTSALVGAIYLHHLHPRFYFTKRDRDMLVLFCQKLASPLQNCDKFESLQKQLNLATQRNRFLEDTMAMIQKNEHEVFSWMEALPCFVWAAEHDNAQSYKTGVCKDCEFRLMRYDGVYRWHLSKAVPILNHSGAILKWVGVTIDIDDLYLAQKAELHKKSNFLANMSHELRTPFSGFHGMLTLLGYSNLDEEQQEIVYTAKQSCEKLLLIIDDLLDFSKLEADKLTLEASPFDLEEVFDEVENIVEPLASQRSLELAFIKDDNVPDMVIGDCNRLKQILLNLVGNAIKFTHSGHVIVRCKVLDRDSDMDTIASGSAADMMDDDKFYFRHEKNGGGQCQSEMRPPNSGRFSTPEPLSENAIKLMFEVEDTGIGISQEEQGSTFWFVIQCEECSAADLTARLSPEADSIDSTKEIKRITRTLGTPRILIASTSETTIKTLQSYLTDFNTEVADLPSAAASRLVESVANGISFDFVCWYVCTSTVHGHLPLAVGNGILRILVLVIVLVDFPKYDPHHTTMLELQSRPSLNNVHFVLLYTPSSDYLRRAQSLQLPPTSGSSASSLGGVRKRPTLSQSLSVKPESGSPPMSNGSVSGICEVPGLSPAKLNSLRITCISKPIRRLKLLKAFVEVLDDSTKIHDANLVKKGTATPLAGPSSPSPSTATTLSSPLGSPLSTISAASTLPSASLAWSACPLTASSLEYALGASEDGDVKREDERPLLIPVDSGSHMLQKAEEQSLVAAALGVSLPQGSDGEVDSSGHSEAVQEEAVAEEVEQVVTVLERGMTPVVPQEPVIPSQPSNTDKSSKTITVTSAPTNSTSKRVVKSPASTLKAKARSNSPKPAKASKLVTDEKTDISLSFEEASRIAGMRILIAEDNIVAQKVLSRQLAMFGLVISCANDGAEALSLFKSHPRGYYTMGFFDHHMPNCDGVQATQQIRALEKEHAAEVKGPVPRLPVVAVSADIQETARKACLNSGMERYVTKPLMQKDLVSMVRQYCVEGDAQASTHPYVPPPPTCDVGSGGMSAEAILATSTIAGMNILSIPPTTTPQPCSNVCERSPSLKPVAAPPIKRELNLTPAQLRGLALIRENTMQDESSKVGGGGNINTMSSAYPTNSTGGSLGGIQSSQGIQYGHQGGLKSQGTYTQGGPLGGVSMSLAKSSSSSSLSASYHGSMQPVLTSAPLTSTSTMMSAGTCYKQGPMAAMAAGAAAAVAVASAAVNTVSSAISDHIHPPSIYAAHSHGFSSANSSASTCGNASFRLESTEKQYPTQYQHYQQQEFQQNQQKQLQQQQFQPSSVVFHSEQQVFVPYVHPCEPGLATGPSESLSKPESEGTPTADSGSAQAPAASVPLSMTPVKLTAWL